MKKIGLTLRSIVFVIALYGGTYMLSLLLLWTLLAPRRALFHGLYFWEHYIAWLERHVVGIHYEVKGRENIPAGACIIAAKHQSAWETLKLHLLLRNPSIVLKAELTRVPIWGWYAKRTGMIPIDRKGGSRTLLRMKNAAQKAAKAGRKIVIFPQGTRLAPNVKKPYKIGVAVLYDELKIPVVPMALNSGLFWPKNTLLKKPGLITIEFLPLIPAGLPRQAMMQKLEEQLEAASDRLAQKATD